MLPNTTLLLIPPLSLPLNPRTIGRPLPGLPPITIPGHGAWISLAVLRTNARSRRISMSGAFEVVSDAVIGGWFARKGEPIYLPIRDGM